MIKLSIAIAVASSILLYLAGRGCPQNSAEIPVAELIVFSGKQVVIQGKPGDRFCGTEIPDVQSAQAAKSGIYIVKQIQSAWEANVYYSSLDSFPRSWVESIVDLSPMGGLDVGAKSSATFHFSENGDFLLIASPHNIDEPSASDHKIDDSTVYRFGVWQRTNGNYRFLGFAHPPKESLLTEGTQASSLTSLNKHSVVAIDCYGVPSILDLRSQAFTERPFAPCRGKLDPAVFSSEEFGKIVSFSVSDGFNRVLDFAIWNLDGSLICDREFIIEGNPEGDLIGRGQSGRFLTNEAFLVFDKHFAGVVYGSDFDKFYRLELRVPSGCQIASIVGSSAEFLTVIAVPSMLRDPEMTILSQDFSVFLEPGNRISLTTNGWKKETQGVLSIDTLGK